VRTGLGGQEWIRLGESGSASYPDGRFGTAVYVLHAFKKKSKRGIKTPQSDIDLIKQRLKAAEADHASRTKREPKK
jgi:hypothetical protein